MLKNTTFSRYTNTLARRSSVRAQPLLSQLHTRPRCLQTLRASSGVESYVVKPIANEADLEAERTWLATAMATWLDEEWTVLPEHKQLGVKRGGREAAHGRSVCSSAERSGQAAASAYVELRRRGEDDMGSVVLAVASELLRPELAAAFRASFTDPFEVSNKLVETVMLRDGCDVCCTSQADRDRIQRINVIMSSGDSSSEAGVCLGKERD
ncbi:hypothetical protein VOLCADRAFT_107181 [Volvox carteri f. nagariensis]|uniref:Uncharacterized protein n=1 Tax=Volvox carteri f. nagariensis TaxID=3068 RepID=D8UCG8_VOLCA|nr:uncharacterized protein VOLCADRAFT_107181 [Volvox carteri f. nagariensis]EFJ42491.1 hypothetical protein VOLCADRAFT_107181 [Volvox carteri f. nagariensis]|eukprot:XP_002956347.1 hypothetical protein VOLCADRAFT_107181 [Volvox carteri f. nagariensis]